MEVSGQLQVLVDFSYLTTAGIHRIEEWMGAGIVDVTRAHISKGFTNSKRRKSYFVCVCGGGGGK